MDNDLSEDKLDTNAIIEKAQNLRKALQERKYFKAAKDAFVLLYALYKQYLKGKYVSVKGKKIPLIAVILAVMVAGYAVIPSAPEDKNAQISEKSVEEIAMEAVQNPDVNTYNQNGIKVYGLYKCNNAVCGYLENSNEKDFARVLISVTFHDEGGNVIYEGGAEAAGVIAMSRIKFTIPAEGDFNYFRLTDVTVER